MRLPYDICRCVGTTCPYRWKCGRFNADPVDDPYATPAWADFSSELAPGHECRYFIRMENE